MRFTEAVGALAACLLLLLVVSRLRSVEEVQPIRTVERSLAMRPEALLPEGMLAPPPPPSPLQALQPPSHVMADGCDPDGECPIPTLVRRHAENNTIIVTFGNKRQKHFSENWVKVLQSLGVGGLLVGMMNMQRTDPVYRSFAAMLRSRGVGVYTVNSYEVKAKPQGGRWFHVLPLLQTGARLILSDSDVVWFRDPRPYLRALEAAHPLMDFAVSSDSQTTTDGRRLGGLGSELDIENFGHCWVSMNIGIMLFAEGHAGQPRPGAIRLINEATTHLLRVSLSPCNLPAPPCALLPFCPPTLLALRPSAL